MRDLTITVVADATQAKRELADVEQSLDKVKVTSKATGLATDGVQESLTELTKTTSKATEADQEYEDWLKKTNKAIEDQVDAATKSTEATKAVTVATSGATSAFQTFTNAVSIWGTVAAAATTAIVALVNAYENWRLSTETEGARQDVINKALSLGAKVGIQYAEAIKFVAEKEADRRAAIPEEAAQQFLDNLSKQAAAGIKAAAAAETLTEGLARLGIVQGMTAEETAKMNHAHDESVKAAKKAREELTKLIDKMHTAESSVIVGFARKIEDVTAADVKFVQQFEKHLAVMQKIELSMTEAQIGTEQFGKELAKLPNAVKAIDQGLVNLLDTNTQVVTTWATMGDRLKGTIDELTGAFAQMAQIGGDSFGGMVRDIGNVLASISVAITAMNQFQTATTLAGKAVGLVAGAAAVWQATGSSSKPASIAGGAATGAAAGSVFGPWGTAIGAGIGALIGWIRSQKAEKEVNKVREAFVQLHGGLANLDKEAHALGLTLKEFLDAKDPQAYAKAVTEITDAMTLQTDSWQKVQDAAQRYGLTIEDLGPAWQRQEMDTKAQQLYEDYQLLIGAGVDVGTVTNKMSDAINNYVQLAVKMGIEVPAAMRPMIQHMIDMGLLVDANGKKITTMEDSGITFSETMTEGFAKVVASVDKMTAAIERFLGITHETGQALDEVANKTRNLPSLPGPINPGDVQTFHRGGVVLPFIAHRGLALDEIPIIAQRGEGILSRAGMRRIGGSAGLNAINSGGGPVVNIYVDGDINTPMARRKLTRVVKQQLVQDLRARRA